MNNYERIKAMSIEEMAKFILYKLDYYATECPFEWNCDTCRKKLNQWLESEVDNEN